MSEHQYIEFRAVDRPLTDSELAFARKQSTRAEITRWSFTNQYHFGDFHGDVNGLLRRGYDIHLHYANYGMRSVAIRLPAGLPFPNSVSSKYMGAEALSWKSDKNGKAGILSLDPFHEAGELDELFEFDQYIHAAIDVRNRLIAGDLRALYALWLCSTFDDQEDLLDVPEPPVPGGLVETVDAFGPLLEFFGLDPLVLAAASEDSMNAPDTLSQEQRIDQWVSAMSEKDARRLLHSFLTKDPLAVKAESVACSLKTGNSVEWPCIDLSRTPQQLLDRAEQLRAEQTEKTRKKRAAAQKLAAAEKQRERQDRMKLMVDDPRKWLRKTEKLVDARGTDNYEAAAEILVDLREALGGTKGEQMTRRHAAHLATKHPTLNRLKSALRQRGLLA